MFEDGFIAKTNQQLLLFSLHWAGAQQNRFSFSKVLKLDSPRRMSKSRPLIYFLSFWVTIEIASSDLMPAFPGTVPPAAQKRQVRSPRISCRIPVAPGSIVASPSVTSEWKAPLNSWTQSDPIGPYRLDKMGIFSDWHLRFLHNFLVWDAQRSILTRITMPIYENLWKCLILMDRTWCLEWVKLN